MGAWEKSEHWRHPNKDAWGEGSLRESRLWSEVTGQEEVGHRTQQGRAKWDVDGGEQAMGVLGGSAGVHTAVCSI